MHGQKVGEIEFHGTPLGPLWKPSALDGSDGLPSVHATSGEVSEHIILLGKPSVAALDGAGKVLSVLVAGGDVLRQVALVGRRLRAAGVRARELLLQPAGGVLGQRRRRGRAGEGLWRRRGRVQRGQRDLGLQRGVEDEGGRVVRMRERVHLWWEQRRGGREPHGYHYSWEGRWVDGWGGGG